MTRRTSLVGFIALVGFLGCLSGASGLLPTPCCSQSKACPGSSCDSTAAKLSAKTDTLLAVAPAPLPQISLPVGRAAAVATSDFLPALPAAFRRPMRN